MKKEPLSFTIILLILLGSSPMLASRPLSQTEKTKLRPSANFVAGCLPAQAQIDLDINNVRARLLTGGDLWWDRHDGGYIVPKPLNGQQGVSAIYAAGVWMGGFDNGGNLKLACQTYGNNVGRSDFWPGPLSQSDGTTEAGICSNWDRLFSVDGAEILEHLQRYQAALDGQTAYIAADIPLGVKGWPSKGNPYFTMMYGFDLPSAQPLAEFYDQDGDNNYEPLDGDFPMVNLYSSCTNYSIQFPDQMVFWIFNDEGGGNIHDETKGIPIKMETQVTSFAYSTTDVLNDMTFCRFRHLSRASEDIDSFYFALWMDVDLGCYFDDYFGCDPARNLAYYYNADAEDGQPGITCDGVPTYGNNIPALGIDLIQGPIDDSWNELGMSNFAYNNILGPNDPPPGTTDPNTDVEFYRYLTGAWKDGSLLAYGGDGYDPTILSSYKFAFPNTPDDPNGWSMCHPGPEFPIGLPSYSRATVQSTGPIILHPGSVNELLYGVVFAPNIDYPCPDLSRLFAADDYVQDWFDNCMEFPAGPNAPDVDWIAGDRLITGILTNPSWSNNAQEDFRADVIGHPRWATDTTYNFEGYLVYQTAKNEFSLDDIYDTTKARLVFQTDLENGFSSVQNWEASPNPNYQLVPGAEQFLYNPNRVIEGRNLGIEYEFTITEDLFAKGSDRRLLNHRNYYYVALAYAVNNFEPFNSTNGMGQKTMYLIGRQNIGPDEGCTYTVLPRPAQGGLDKVQIVPNPFYNASAYADADGNGVVKITNLPAKCEVNIYSLDGKMVRHFSRNEVPAPPFGSGIAEQQIYPDLIWELKNGHGKTIASGIYLVNIQVEGIGEITLKAVII
ncbi:MAG: hypothetical protein GC192_20500 [Bacteroidetes bacterium]|nr:hypothetical protein [Bacteroidota bacterium]